MRNKVERYYIQTLSPVHSGSGIKLQKDLDYISGGGRVWMIHPPALQQALVENSQALLDFTEKDEFDLLTIVNKYDFDLKKLIRTSYRGYCEARELHSFERNGMGTPYLPGSAIKGALRTALLWTLCQEDEIKNQWPAVLENALSTSARKGMSGNFLPNLAFNVAKKKNKKSMDANNDLMRVIHVGDAHFEKSDLTFSDVRIFNLGEHNNAGWKRFGRENQDRPEKGTQLAVESIRKGAVAEMTLQFDRFLFESPQAREVANFQIHRDSFDHLAELCNAYAARQIAAQKEFFEEYRQYGVEAMVRFYEQLESRVAGLENGDFILRLSWGSGWQGMTGDLFDNNDELNQIRDHFKLGKYKINRGKLPGKCPNKACQSENIKHDRKKEGMDFCFDCHRSFPVPGYKKTRFPVFPKTRKVVLENGAPDAPLGWVIFSKTPPKSSPAEDRSNFVPDIKMFPRQHSGERKKPDKKPTGFKPVSAKPKPAIRRGERLKAEVVKVEGKQVLVRLLKKDEGREIRFKLNYKPNFPPGKIVTVRVEATSKDGREVTQVQFLF